ncbi:hypothetical protein JYT87_00190 [Nitrospira defluvii]|nr:hypothetical protein [Nitrospira defluvii]
MRHNMLFSSRGTTLVELMIGMVISVTMVAVISGIIQNTLGNYIGNREKSQTQMRSRMSIDFLAQELRNAGYIISWDPNSIFPPLGINQAIPGATVDPNTESMTIRYALAPLALTLKEPPVGNDLQVDALPTIAANSLIAIYSPPSTVNVLRVLSTDSSGPGQKITLTSPPTSAFVAGDFVAAVIENAFWIEGGNLMMRSDGNNQLLSSGVEDLQVALINLDQSVIGDVDSAAFAGMTTAQILNVRAVRLSLTGRSNRLLKEKQTVVPPSLEDHDRSAEAPDQFVRRVQITTAYLRNMGVLNP